MKKIIYVFFCVLVCLTAAFVAGCTGSSPKNENEERDFSLSVTANKTEYEWNEDFVALVSVNIVYEDGATEAASDYSIDSSAYDKTTPGEYVIVVSLGEKSATYTVTVKRSETVGAIETEPGKTEFKWGEDFSQSGLKVTAVFEDGRRMAVEDGFTVDASAYDPAKAGEYEIVVSYAGKTDSYTVAVKQSEVVTKYEFTLLTAEFAYGEDFDGDCVKAERIYEDGRRENETEFTVDFGGYDKTTAGVYEIIATAPNGYTETFEVTVKQSEIARKLTLSGQKTEFKWGEDFSLGSLVVVAEFTDGREEEVAGYSVSGDYDKHSAGVCEMKVSYAGASETYTVSVAPKPVPTHFDLSEAKTEYEYGDRFEELEFDATYSDGETKRITDGYECDYDAFRVGEQTVKISYDGYEQTITVNVKKATKLSLLMIGNSFADDSIVYAYSVAQSLGIPYENINVANLYRGGCSLATHLSNARSDSAAYSYRVYNPATQSWYMPNGEYDTKMSDAITRYPWDYISFQQASADSGKSDTYSSLSALKTYVSERATNPKVRYIWLMTWAYAQSYNGLSAYNNSQRFMYDSIVSAVRSKISTRKDIDVILPTGTAIQNARTSYFGDTLNRDGTHLSTGEGRYIAALSLVCSLTGYTPDEVTFAPSGLDEFAVKVCKESATNALNKPFGTTDSAYPDAEAFYDEIKAERSKLEYTPSQGFWNSTDANYPTTVITTNASLSPKFAATPRFSRLALPAGTLIEIADGYYYRPEGWTGDSKMSTRPGNVSTKYVFADEKWWADFSTRAFNIAKNNGDPITPAEAKAALTLWVPADNGYAELADYGLRKGFYNAKEKYELLSAEENPSSTFATKTFVATRHLTREDLPVGSLIYLKSGYKYRPDGWEEEGVALSSTRPGEETAAWIYVNEEWWGNFKVRGFNIKRADQSELSIEDAASALKIYIPVSE